MATITIWDTGSSGLKIKGDIQLVKHDTRTDDFEIRINRKHMHVVFPDTLDNDWAWLHGYPIESIEFAKSEQDTIELYPTWSYTKYGTESSMNQFQKITLTDDEIVLSVEAGGTPIEVFDRSLPYIDKKTEKKDYRTWNEREAYDEQLDKEFKASDFDPEKQVNKWFKQGLDENDIAKQIFE